MFPGSAILYGLNTSVGKTVGARDSSVASTGVTTNSRYNLCRDLRLPVSFTFRLPVLSDHIIHVFFMRSYKQVIWVAAKSAVASVKNMLPYGDWPFVEFVGQFRYTIVSLASYHHEAIAPYLTFKPNPAPAIWVFIDASIYLLAHRALDIVLFVGSAGHALISAYWRQRTGCSVVRGE